MDHKGIAPLVIVAIVVVAAAVVSVGAYVALSGGSSGTTTTSASIEDAASLSMKMDMTVEDTLTTMDFKVKGIGTSDLMMRVDLTLMGQNMVLVINESERSAWAFTGGIWMDMSSEFDQYWEQMDQAFEQAKDQLRGWTGEFGGTYTYTEPSTGATVRIYDIQINPNLDDSLFQHD